MASRATLYCVTVLTASPTLNPDPETGTATAEISSTSVTRSTPIAEASRRMTLPVESAMLTTIVNLGRLFVELELKNR